MEIRYRETRSDFIRWHRLNKTGVMSQWRNYLIVCMALLPTAFILWAFHSNYSALWMSIAAIVMLMLAGYRWFVPLVRFPLCEHVDVFDRHLGTRRSSSSIGQWKWERIEEIRETKKEFQFWRNDVGSILPKRVLTVDQENEVRNLLKEVQQPVADSPPLPLYQDRFLSESVFPVYRYQMSSVDAQQIVSSKLRPYESNDSNGVRKSGSMVRQLFGFVFLLSVFLWATAFFFRADILFSDVTRDLLICLMPFVVLWLIARTRSWFRITRLFKLPSDEISVRLCHDGLAIGAPDYVSLLHWNDVTGLLANDHYLGFRTIHSLIHLVPMRAIGDETAVERFMENVVELKSVADKEAAAVAQSEPVDSDNPYQAPMSQ